MIISNQKNTFTFNFKIRESILMKLSTVKFLGVTVNKNLTFNDHVKKVTSKISKSVGVTRRLHCQLPANVMVKLNYSLVYSNLTYVLLGWLSRGVLMLQWLSVLTGEGANYSQIINKIGYNNWKTCSTKEKSKKTPYTQRQNWALMRKRSKLQKDKETRLFILKTFDITMSTYIR